MRQEAKNLLHRRNQSLKPTRRQSSSDDLADIVDAEVEPLTLFGRPTYTKNQAMTQAKLEDLAEKMSCLDTLEHCENTVYRLVPNLP